ncbi:hypothetical protein OBP_033 [Pseudomonas phage OBP]|uniref:hypothetical protein n=1 Tax=Pseudomonas phage OBP TaxID=1124849 RepID=UPI000240D61E|nr:hypothetical protein OBP_033 [Pseudomonas phage OBP]AEV89470.1 hypothetical protein OBP_033 [Pseudomonas phage OBP]
MSNSILEINLIHDQSIEKEVAKQALANRDFSVVKDIIVNSDTVILNFEQSNELKRLVLEALRKVTAPKEEDPFLLADQVYHYLLTLYSVRENPDKTEIKFSSWLAIQYPEIGGLAEVIASNNIQSYSNFALDAMAKVEGLTRDRWLQKVRETWGGK